MHTTLSLAGRMAGVSTLVIGMPECGTYSKMVIPEPFGKAVELHWVYLLDGNEVVFGCSKSLGEAIKEMDAATAPTGIAARCLSTRSGSGWRRPRRRRGLS
jgi:hypothetical protein